MRIFLSGGSGFIGKELIKKLSLKKFKILVLTRKERYFKSKNIDQVIGDFNLSEKNILKIKRFKPKIFIHLAWSQIPDYSFTNSFKNLKNQINFFETIKLIKSIKKIIVTGSCWEYMQEKGICDDINAIDLNTNASFNEKIIHFVLAKKNLLQYLFSRFKEKKIVWLRLFYVYGTGQKKNSLIPFLISKSKKNLKAKLNNPNGANDFVNVSDVCDAIIKSLNYNESGIFNVGSGILISNKSIKDTVENFFRNKKFKFKKNNKYKKLVGYKSSNIKIKKRMGWEPKISFENGLKKVLENA